MTIGDELEAIRRFRDWQESVIMNEGRQPSFEEYEKYLRSMKVDMLLSDIRACVDADDFAPEERLAKIGELLNDR